MKASRSGPETKKCACVAAIHRLGGTTLILIGNALTGLLLAAVAAAVLLAKMRPPLEDELMKRAAAVCRAAAADLQYAVTVGDRHMMERRLEQLEREPSARVDGGWLTEERQILGRWLRPGNSGAGRIGTAVAAGAFTRDFVESHGERHALVSCPVEPIQAGGSWESALGGTSAQGARLWLLLDLHEVSATVRRGLVGALGLLLLAILCAVGLQLAIALYVIRKLNGALRTVRETQAALVQADKLASVGTLAAGVAHEINNPLAFVLSNVQFALEGLADRTGETQEDPEEVRQALREALEGAERVRVIVKDLKTLARTGEEQRGPVDLAKVLDSAIKIVGNETRHRARLVRDIGSLPLVHGCEGRLNQVFVNLLVNAAQAIPDGSVERNEIRVSAWAEGPSVLVEVSDTGCGIPGELLPRLFDPFFTTKPVGSGTGLGLSVCHGIVTAHGGELSVKSAPGRGSTFRVVLPASTRLPERPPDVRLPPGKNVEARVLVIDDEPLVGTSLRRMLEPESDVVCTTQARDALSRLELGEQFDLIFCDVMMPEMPGAEFHDRLAEHHPDAAARIVFMSGGVFTKGAQESLARLPNPCIEKPFVAQVVRRMVEELVGLRGRVVPLAERRAGAGRAAGAARAGDPLNHVALPLAQV